MKDRLSYTIEPKEWVWVTAIGSGAVLLAFIPYLIGWLQSGEGGDFTGALFLQTDTFSYFYKIRLGMRGYWLLNSMYAVEPHPQSPLYLHYIWLGRVLGLFVGPRGSVEAIEIAFHLWRLGGGIFLTWTLYHFYSLLFTDVPMRRLALFLALLGGGLGGLLALGGQDTILGTPPLDLFLGEAYSIVALTAIPHVLWARGCMLWGFMVLAKLLGSNWGSWQDTLVLSGLWLVMTICLPFALQIVLVVTLVWLLIGILRRSPIPLRGVFLGGLAGIPSVVLLVPSYLLFRTDPFYQYWYEANQLESPHLLNMVFAYGPPVILAIAGATFRFKHADTIVLLCVAWMVAAALLVMSPLRPQLRLVEGATVAAWGLGVFALSRAFEVINHMPRVKFAAYIICGLLAASTSIIYVSALSLVVAGKPELFGKTYVYVPADLRQILDWLNANAPFESVLLSGEPTGAYAPACAGVRSVVAHVFETPEYYEKLDEVTAFYSKGMDDKERRDLLEKYDVLYVLVGPYEASLVCENCTGIPFDPARIGLDTAVQSGQYTLYEVTYAQ